MPTRWIPPGIDDPALRMGACVRCGTKWCDAPAATFECEDCLATVTIPADPPAEPPAA